MASSKKFILYIRIYISFWRQLLLSSRLSIRSRGHLCPLSRYETRHHQIYIYLQKTSTSSTSLGIYSGMELRLTSPLVYKRWITLTSLHGPTFPIGVPAARLVDTFAHIFVQFFDSNCHSPPSTFFSIPSSSFL